MSRSPSRAKCCTSQVGSQLGMLLDVDVGCRCRAGSALPLQCTTRQPELATLTLRRCWGRSVAARLFAHRIGWTRQSTDRNAGAIITERHSLHSLRNFSLPTHIFLSRCAGEESVEQIGSRAERMGLMANSNIFLYSATRMDVCPFCRHVQMSKFAMHCCRAVCVCRRCPGAVLLKGLSATFTLTTVSRPLCAGHPAGDSGDAAGGGHHRLHPDGVPG